MPLAFSGLWEGVGQLPGSRPCGLSAVCTVTAFAKTRLKPQKKGGRMFPKKNSRRAGVRK